MSAPSLTIRDGVALALFVYDAGLAIDLDSAQSLVSARAAETARESIKHPIGTRRTPEYFEFRAPPLRIDLPAEPIPIGPAMTEARIECTLYDFGAVSVVYRIPLSGDLSTLLELADDLYENVTLLADSRRRVDDLTRVVAPAISRPRLAANVEDYVIYHLRRVSDDQDNAPPWPDWPPALRALLAQVLRAERLPLSHEESSDALWCSVSYGESDAVVIDWNAAVVLQDHAEDILSVLEFANVELLELRFLDDRLDEILDRSYERIVRRADRGSLLPGSDSEEARRLAAIQVDSALLFENVNNALKLLGDQYLARVYRLAAQRLHLPEWDATILRKIQTVRDLYDKIHDERSARRMEFLEWIIIILIAVSIVLPFLGLGH